MTTVGNFKGRKKKIKRNKNMAIVFKNKDAFLTAKGIVGDDLKKITEEYKKSGQAYIEGTNAEVHNQPGYIRFMDKGVFKKSKKVKKSKK